MWTATATWIWSWASSSVGINQPVVLVAVDGVEVDEKRREI